MSFQKRTLVVVMGLSLALLLTDLASAQRRRGRGFFGTPRVQLASLSEVQADLKLNDEQKKLAKELSDKYGEDRRDAFQGGGGGGGFAAARERLQKLSDEATAKLVEKLDDAQKKRLMEIFVQYNGTAALTDKDVAGALKITEEQNKKLADVREANRQSNREAFQDLQDASREERQEKFAEMREAGDKKLLEALSEDQREQFGKLGGKELEVDLSPLFGGFNN